MRDALRHILSPYLLRRRLLRRQLLLLGIVLVLL